MKIRLKKPFPQIGYGKVIPAGVVIDAPPALYGRLLKMGIGISANEEKAQQSAVATRKKRRPAGRSVKRNG